MCVGIDTIVLCIQYYESSDKLCIRVTSKPLV